MVEGLCFHGEVAETLTCGGGTCSGQVALLLKDQCNVEFSIVNKLILNKFPAEEMNTKHESRSLIYSWYNTTLKYKQLTKVLRPRLATISNHPSCNESTLPESITKEDVCVTVWKYGQEWSFRLQ